MFALSCADGKLSNPETLKIPAELVAGPLVAMATQMKDMRYGSGFTLFPEVFALPATKFTMTFFTQVG